MNEPTHLAIPPVGVAALLLGFAATVGIVFVFRALPRGNRRDKGATPLLCGLLCAIVTGLGAMVFFLTVKIELIRSEQAVHEEVRRERMASKER